MLTQLSITNSSAHQLITLANNHVYSVQEDYMSILEGGKNIEDCCITRNKLKYTNYRIKLNTVFTHMKSLFTGTPESMNDQIIYILENCFDSKGLKTSSVGKVIFSEDFNNTLTPEVVLHAMESSFWTVFNQNFGRFANSSFNEELFDVARRYVKVRGKYLVGTSTGRKILCQRNAILNREEIFHKKACIMMNPESTSRRTTRKSTTSWTT